MIQPAVLVPRPSFILAALGGGVATLLISALLNLAPLLGFPFMDFPRLTGGIFSSAPEVAYWLGYGLFFLIGALVLPALLMLFWPALPGSGLGFGSALLKGLSWGLVLWIASGALLPLFGVLNRVLGLQSPGFFALRYGVSGAAGLLLGHLVYGAALALVAAMGQSINPLDTIGWVGYEKAETRELGPAQRDRWER